MHREASCGKFRTGPAGEAQGGRERSGSRPPEMTQASYLGGRRQMVFSCISFKGDDKEAAL